MTEAKFALKREPVLNLAKISNSYSVHVWNEEEFEYHPQNAISVFEIEDGAVYLDGHPIVHPRFERDGLTWCQKEAGRFSSGVIHFTPDGMAFAGVIYLGSEESRTMRYDVSGIVPPTVYTTKVSVTGKEAPAAGDGQWDTGVRVKIGYKYTTESALPVPIIELDDVDALQSAAMVINPKNQNLQLHIVYSSEFVKYHQESLNPAWPASGMIEFSWNAKTFSGSMKRFDPEKSEETTLEFEWTGEIQKPAAVTAVKRENAPALLAVTALSIEELMTLSPEGVQDLSFKMLLENMKWAMDDTTREQMLGQTKPALEQRRIDLIKKDIPFYQNRFVPAYLGYGVVNMSGIGDTYTPAEKEKLKAYLHAGIAKESGYNIQSNGLYLEAFLESSPPLQKYMADGEAWATKLFDELATPAQINLTMNRIIAAKSMELLNRFCTILSVLQPSAKLSGKYYELFISKALTQLIPDVNFDDMDLWMKWLPDIIDTFITKYLPAPTDPTEGNLALWEMAKALDEAKKQLGNTTMLAQEMASVVVAAQGGTMMARMANAAQAWVARHPGLMKVKGFLLFAAWTYGLNQTISTFQNWEKLEAEEKISLVLSTVGLFGNMVQSIPAILSVASWGWEGMKSILNYFARPSNIAQVAEAVAAANANWVAAGAESVKNCFDAAGKAITTEGTAWGAAFKKINIAMKWFGVLVSAGFAILATIDFIKAIKDGASTMDQAFLGIIACATILQTVCMAASLLLASQIMATLGTVFAVIGLVFSLVVMFMPQPKPESPVEKFSRETVRPFINGLPAPTPAYRALIEISGMSAASNLVFAR